MLALGSTAGMDPLIGDPAVCLSSPFLAEDLERLTSRIGVFDLEPDLERDPERPRLLLLLLLGVTDLLLLLRAPAPPLGLWPEWLLDLLSWPLPPLSPLRFLSGV
jgi:hypothetical protein